LWKRTHPLDWSERRLPVAHRSFMPNESDFTADLSRFPLVPIVLVLMIRYWVPESPRWLIRMGRPPVWVSEPACSVAALL
jgi:hypothetical protein